MFNISKFSRKFTRKFPSVERFETRRSYYPGLGGNSSGPNYPMMLGIYALSSIWINYLIDYIEDLEKNA